MKSAQNEAFREPQYLSDQKSELGKPLIGSKCCNQKRSASDSGACTTRNFTYMARGPWASPYESKGINEQDVEQLQVKTIPKNFERRNLFRVFKDMCSKISEPQWLHMWQDSTHRRAHVGHANVQITMTVHTYMFRSRQSYRASNEENPLNSFIYIYILSTIYQLANHKRGFAPRDHPIYPIFHLPKAVLDS